MGCTNEQCTFAHGPYELRGPEWDAWTDAKGFPTRFVRPDDADPKSKDLRPKAALPFVVRLYDESDSSDDDYEPPSLYLSHVVKHNEEWKRHKLAEARWARMWHLQKVKHALTTHMGEQDMDMSDDDKEPQSDLRELDMDLDSDEESAKPAGKSDLTEKDMELDSDTESAKPAGKSDLTEKDMELDSDDE